MAQVSACGEYFYPMVAAAACFVLSEALDAVPEKYIKGGSVTKVVIGLISKIARRAGGEIQNNSATIAGA